MLATFREVAGALTSVDLCAYASGDHVHGDVVRAVVSFGVEIDERIGVGVVHRTRDRERGRSKRQVHAGKLLNMYFFNV